MAPTPQRTVADAVTATLEAAGATRVYGAPGTTELALVRAFASRGLPYLAMPHDTAAVGLADGFARASGGLGVANLHSSQGTLNAAGFIRAAHRDEVPVVVVAGLPSTAYDLYEPNHYVPGLAQLLTPITKWARVVVNPELAAETVARAIGIARSPLPGPVFVGLPQDVLEAVAPARVRTGLADPAPASTAAPADVARAAVLLAEAERPVVFAGFRARTASGGVEEIAELLGAPIVLEALDRGPQVQGTYCAPSHPLLVGCFDSRDELVARTLEDADVVLLVGTRATYRRVVSALLDRPRIVELNAVPEVVGKDRPVAAALAGDVPGTLRDLVDATAARLGDDGASRARDRDERTRRAVAARREAERRELADASVSAPEEGASGLELVRALVATLPSETVIVDDSQSLSHYLKRFLSQLDPAAVFGSLASHLGWAAFAALGVKEARPESLVVCLIGDGSALFGLQALPAAALHGIPVLFVVADNRGFVSLQFEAAARWPGAPGVGDLSLEGASFDYAAVARGFGLAGIRVEDPRRLEPDLARAVAIVRDEARPCLLDVLMPSAPDRWAEAWSV